MEQALKRKSGVTGRLKDDVIFTFTDKRGSSFAALELERAIAFTEELHRGQMRADGQAHFDHLLRVTRYVIRWRKYRSENPFRLARNAMRYGTRQDMNLIRASLLHDSVEDQSAKLAAMFDALPEKQVSRALPEWQERFSSEQIKALRYLSHRFGEDVARLVAGVTIVKPSGHDAESRREYVRGWHAHVAKIIAEKHRRLFLIKLADFYDNATGIDTVENDAKRLALAEKYLAVYRLFVKGMGTMRSLIAGRNRRLIAQKLEKAEMVAKGIVGREDGGERG